MVGLALGSGSARGWAHLGVLRALDDLGIRPGVIVGCSVGAMVGAAWAVRMLGPFEHWARNLTRRDLIGFLDVGFGGSLVKGERLTRLFDRWAAVRIESLSRRFAAVATDLASGERLCFESGPLVDAVRASMSMPGLLPPMRLDGRWLVDGALVDPIPIELCRRLGADRVIAVNLNHGIVTAKASRRLARRPAEELDDPGLEVDAAEPAAPERGPSTRLPDRLADGLEELKARLAAWVDDSDDPPEPLGFYDVLVGSMHILQDRVACMSLERHPPDLELRPRLGEIGLLEVYRADEVIEEGRRVVFEAADALRELAES